MSASRLTEHGESTAAHPKVISRIATASAVLVALTLPLSPSYAQPLSNVSTDATIAHKTTTGTAVVNVLVASLHANCFSSAGCVRSGLSQTSSFNFQLRVDRDQRRGLRCLAAA
jgi:hypothetical protein